MSRRGGRRAGTSTQLLSVALGAVLAGVVYAHGAEDPTALAPTTTALPASTARPTPEAASASESASDPAPADRCAGAIAALPPRARLAQLLVVGVNPAGPADALNLVTGDRIGGIFIGGDPVGLLSDGALTSVHAASALPLMVAVDDEGGRVQRIDALDGSMLSARRMVATLSPEQVRAAARERGLALRARGVTTDLAPVADITDQPDRTVIGDRSFSADPVIARRYALAFATGLHDAGVLPVLKHFPGHGHATGDSHLGAVLSPPLEVLRGADLVPYRDIAEFGEVAVLLGHIDVPGLTGGRPATLSPEAYALLRDEFGFAGPAMTDDLGAMRAVTDRVDLPDAVTQALAAGADLALWSQGGRVAEVLDRLERAVATGELPPGRADQALRRVLAAKHVC